MVAALPRIRSEKMETVMQNSASSPVRNRETSLGLCRGNVQEFQRRLDRPRRWEDEVATVALVLLVAILFVLVYEAIFV
jgi:hypothetical protein